MISKAPILALIFSLVACANSPSDGYERHSLSRIVEVPDSSSEFVFEVGRPSAPGDAEAEAIRMRWLAEWLDVQGKCLIGHEIVDKRLFGPFEYNPVRAEFRYLVRCRAEPVEVPEDE